MSNSTIESPVARVARLEAALSFARGNLGARDQYRISADLDDARQSLAVAVLYGVGDQS